MPAYTVSQLGSLLDTYVELGKPFTVALGQVLPRIYALGMWRDTSYEISLSGKYGYVSLPDGSDSVLACTVNDRARPVRSLWHDVRITGRHPLLSTYYGIVDAGFHPVALDMKEVQDVGTEEEVVGIPNPLYAYSAGTNSPVTGFTGDVEITTDRANGGLNQKLTQGVITTTPFTGLAFTGSSPFKKILNITYTEVNESFDLVDPEYPDKVIATVPTGSGVVRCRRFRTSEPNENTVVHLLIRRECPWDLTPDTVVHLGNIGAIKHGLLGLISEDNADIERASYHWGMCGKLLDQELSSVLGSAKPTLKLDLSGCASAAPIYNLY